MKVTAVQISWAEQRRLLKTREKASPKGCSGDQVAALDKIEIMLLSQLVPIITVEEAVKPDDWSRVVGRNRDIIVAARGTLDSFETLCRSRFLSAFAS